MAGFHHRACVEVDPDCCATLRLNRKWLVEQADLRVFDGAPFVGKVDLFAGGLPCPPFSVAGKQLGERDERNLFPAALRLIEQIKPRAVMIENVKGLLGPSFADYRASIEQGFTDLGFVVTWKLLNASDFGVPQLRPRALMVALPADMMDLFKWPKGRVPHIAIVTGEPLPSRLASVAPGTGDIDCVYHFALQELIEAVGALGQSEASEMLALMIEGRRLRDISDLPLDLAT